MGDSYYAINWTLSQSRPQPNLFPSTVYIDFYDSVNSVTYTPDLINITNGTLVLPDGIDNGNVSPFNWSTISANDFVYLHLYNTGPLYLNLYQARGINGSTFSETINSFRLSLTMTRIGPDISAPIPCFPS